MSNPASRQKGQTGQKADGRNSGQEKENGDGIRVRYWLCPGIILTSIGSRSYVVTSSGKMELNESAAFYLRCLEKGVCVEDMLELACVRYEIEDREALRGEIVRFIRICMEKSLVTGNGEENGTKP